MMRSELSGCSSRHGRVRAERTPAADQRRLRGARERHHRPQRPDPCVLLPLSMFSGAWVLIESMAVPTFDVEAGHVQTITSGTCRFFFQNNGPLPLEYCWLSLAQTASQAGNACFPPVQPMSSEGLCVSSDSSWEVGAAHS
ncbi:hypothetical protein C2E23DRAFT_844907 [Lenzites betulinus]|nr:hypothetical protein C2E23DRAFT_844907 [Lenzites betulinus]